MNRRQFLSFITNSTLAVSLPKSVYSNLLVIPPEEDNLTLFIREPILNLIGFGELGSEVITGCQQRDFEGLNYYQATVSTDYTIQDTDLAFLVVSSEDPQGVRAATEVSFRLAQKPVTVVTLLSSPYTGIHQNHPSRDAIEALVAHSDAIVDYAQYGPFADDEFSSLIHRSIIYDLIQAIESFTQALGLNGLLSVDGQDLYQMIHSSNYLRCTSLPVNQKMLDKASYHLRDVHEINDAINSVMLSVSGAESQDELFQFEREIDSLFGLIQRDCSDSGNWIAVRPYTALEERRQITIMTGIHCDSVLQELSRVRHLHFKQELI